MPVNVNRVNFWDIIDRPECDIIGTYVPMYSLLSLIPICASEEIKGPYPEILKQF
jgi:hypothetical protein